MKQFLLKLKSIARRDELYQNMIKSIDFRTDDSLNYRNFNCFFLKY